MSLFAYLLSVDRAQADCLEPVQKVTSTYIDAEVASGQLCLTGSRVSPGTSRTSTVPVKVNGVLLTPAAGTTIVLDLNAGVVSSTVAAGFTAKVTAALPLGGFVALPLGDTKGVCLFGKCAGGVYWPIGPDKDHRVRIGQFDPASYPAVKTLLSNGAGMPVTGKLTLDVAQKKAVASLILTLPNWFAPSPNGGSITGLVSAGISNGGGLSFDGAHIVIPKAFIGVAEISDLQVDYASETTLSLNGGAPKTYKSLWQGSFTVKFPGLGTISSQGNPPNTPYGIGFSAGDGLIYAGVVATPDPAIPLAEGVFLGSVGADFQRNPLTIRGSATILAFDPTVQPISITGQVLIGFATNKPGQSIALSQIIPGSTTVTQSFTAAVAGTASFLNKIQFADGHVIYAYPGYLELAGNVGKSFGPVSLTASALGKVNIKTREFFMSAGANLCYDGYCEGGNMVVSSIGIGGCASIHGWSVGGYYKWSGDWDAFWHACDVTGPLYVDVKPLKHGVRAAATVSPLSVTIADPSLVFSVSGSSATPAFDLVSPSGRTISIPGNPTAPTPADVTALSAVGDPDVRVLVSNPEKGSWRIVPKAGSDIVKVERAQVLPDPAVQATLSGSGRTRSLSWRSAPLSGQTISFMVQGDRTWQEIGTARGSATSGKISFTLDEGDAGPRKVVALVRNGNTIRRSVDLATYTAPGPVVPSAPRGLKITRSASTLKVAWAKQASGDEAVVVLSLGDGQVLAATSPGSSALFTVPATTTATAKVGFLHGDRSFGATSQKSG